MIVTLWIIGAFSFALAVLAFVSAINASDIQFILSGVCAIAGTVALCGVAVLKRLDVIARRLADNA